MQARDGVLKGARWRVGDGVNIQIWQHRWLPIEGGGRVLSLQWDPSLQVVCDLFLPGSRIWNEELIDQSFWEAEIIKSILVSKYAVADALIWPLSSNREYTVRSAYRLLIGLQLRGQASSSNVVAGKSLWNNVWKLRVPNKVRHFVWRAVCNSLPTKLNLHKHQVVSEGLCDMCRDYLEDSIHMQ